MFIEDVLMKLKDATQHSSDINPDKKPLGVNVDHFGNPWSRSMSLSINFF